ncbi:MULTISPECIES: trypsin-like peptidase domain-containing protein [unclassified Clostridium]|uniref:trypsin-like peptidase domain-containing protein n=1 Tax=unclassified Clostridium TaxID=2614128 RepID=UPI0013F0DD1F|nr:MULTISPECIES: trypsin-like peptidase domain-containing protein [unclassified Clostridium]NFG61076.1 trypsin-like peptidase domain-containing protein [Clostridium botulinum]NFQ09338.1 trypsin-like peptidase domain-containing protein [Clostridium botulinum]
MIENTFDNSIFFPFTDPFIQVKYNYNINELEYLLKLCFFIGNPIYITGANLWQSKLSIELFNRARILFDLKEEKCLGSIKLSTRNLDKVTNVFSEYFNQRLYEKEHYITLPGNLQLLDYQIPQTYLVAEQLDNIAKPFMRIGGNVTKVLAKNIQAYFKNNRIIASKVNEDILKNDISRATIAHNIITSPYSNEAKEKFIMESNREYYIANAVSNECLLIYPETKKKIILYDLNRNLQYNVINLFNSIGLNINKINSISYDALYILEKSRLLNKFRKYILNDYLDSTKIINNVKILKIMTEVINKLCTDNYYLKRLKDTTQEIYFEKDILNEKIIFYYNLHFNLINGAEDNMKDVNISDLTNECINKFSLSELKDIANEVCGNYELFPHSTISELARELCSDCKRKNTIDKLLSACMKKNINFNLYTEDLFLKNSITDWKASDEKGKKYTIGEYREIVNRSYKFHSINFIEMGLQMKKRVCLLEINCEDEPQYKATGFLINDEYIITNKHVIPYPESVINSSALFDYEESASSKKFKCNLDHKNTYISEQYDIAITKILKTENSEYFLDLPKFEIGDPKENDCIPIIQHADGMPKQICIGYNSLKYADDEILQYVTSTLPGSSGAPIFNSEWKVIGIHSKGGEIEPKSNDLLYRNEGISIKCIKNFLDDCGIKINKDELNLSR